MESIFPIDFVHIATDGAIDKMSSPVDEIEIINLGLSVKALRKLEHRMLIDVQTSERIFHTTRRTIERYAKHKKRLNSAITENALAQARLATFGTEYFGTVERWNEWLSKPNIQFKNKKPESVMHTQPGRELIKRVIGGLKYGFTA